MPHSSFVNGNDLTEIILVSFFQTPHQRRNVAGHDERHEVMQLTSTRESSGEELIGHVPIELSFLFSKFIEKEVNEIVAEIKGGRKT